MENYFFATEYLWIKLSSIWYNRLGFDEVYKCLSEVLIKKDWGKVPNEIFSRIDEAFGGKKSFSNWLIDSGNATCQDPGARMQLEEIKDKIKVLHDRRCELEMDLGNIMCGESDIFLGIECDSLAHDTEHSEEFNDVKQLLWLSMKERYFWEMIDCNGDYYDNNLYDMNMELFAHIKKMFPDYIKQLMLPNSEEYEQVISELNALKQKYDDAHTLITFTLNDGRTLEVTEDWQFIL